MTTNDPLLLRIFWLFVIFVVISIVAPIITYLLAKLVTFGVLTARRQFEQMYPKEKEHPENGKT